MGAYPIQMDTIPYAWMAGRFGLRDRRGKDYDIVKSEVVVLLSSLFETPKRMRYVSSEGERDLNEEAIHRYLRCYRLALTDYELIYDWAAENLDIGYASALNWILHQKSPQWIWLRDKSDAAVLRLKFKFHKADRAWMRGGSEFMVF